jgi:hypothetical protein
MESWLSSIAAAEHTCNSDKEKYAREWRRIDYFFWRGPSRWMGQPRTNSFSILKIQQYLLAQ